MPQKKSASELGIANEVVKLVIVGTAVGVQFAENTV